MRERRSLSALLLLAWVILGPAATAGAESECPETLRFGFPPISEDRRFADLFERVTAEISRDIERPIALRRASSFEGSLLQLRHGEVQLAALGAVNLESALGDARLTPIVVSEPWPVLLVRLDREGLGRSSISSPRTVAVVPETWGARLAQREFAGSAGGGGPQDSGSVHERWVHRPTYAGVLQALHSGAAEAAVIPGFLMVALSDPERRGLRVLKSLGLDPGTAIVVGPCVSEREREKIAGYMVGEPRSDVLQQFLSAGGLTAVLHTARDELRELLAAGHAAPPTVAGASFPDGCDESVRISVPPTMERGRFKSVLEPMLREAALAAGRPATEALLTRDRAHNLQLIRDREADLTLMSMDEAQLALEQPGVKVVARSPGWPTLIVTRKRSPLQSVQDDLGRVAILEGATAGRIARDFLTGRGYAPESGRIAPHTTIDGQIMAVLEGDTDTAIVPAIALDWLGETARPLLRSLGSIGASPGISFVAGPCVSQREATIMGAWLGRARPAPQTAIFVSATGLDRLIQVDTAGYLAYAREILERSRGAAPAKSAEPSAAR